METKTQRLLINVLDSFNGSKEDLNRKVRLNILTDENKKELIEILKTELNTLNNNGVANSRTGKTLINSINEAVEDLKN